MGVPLELFPLAAALVAGFLLGLAAARVLGVFQAKTARELAEELFDESERQKREQVEMITDHLKDAFGSLSMEALSRSTEEFLKLARSRMETERELGSRELEEKKGLIDRQLEAMAARMESLSELVNELEKDRVEKFGELAGKLHEVSRSAIQLNETTDMLRRALANTKARGQWGERMAEDVLKAAGFAEGINYQRQLTLEGGTRPDFTFMLPKGLLLNMDVKFPYDNYLRYLEANDQEAKDRSCRAFLKDVRSRIREVASRAYIDPENGTVDYALLFIPNEQVYAFIHEQDASILDDALAKRVVLCSPVTLYAVLAVVRQAVENFALEETSREILSLYGVFRKQWEAFMDKLDVLGKRLFDAQKEYDALITTRRRGLDRSLERIENLRAGSGPESAEEGNRFDGDGLDGTEGENEDPS
jgi:DNA recombination protein RmuC